MKNLEFIGLDESKVNKVKDALAQLLEIIRFIIPTP